MKVLLPASFSALVREGVDGDVELLSYGDLTDLRRLAWAADVLWADIWPASTALEVIERTSSVLWISTHAAGVNFLPLDLLRGRRCKVTSAVGLQAVAVAEFAVGLVLAAAVGLPTFVRAQERRTWLGGMPAARRELAGTSALVVGYGHIGRAIGERLQAFGVNVIGVRRSGPGPGLLDPEAWRQHLGEFDWVILSTPLTASTHHIIGPKELGAMRASSWLINVARGGLIDESALVEALRSGSIAGACLDTSQTEPIPSQHALWSLSNVVLTPHVAGLSAPLAERAARLFVDNLGRYRSGRPLLNEVDLVAGY
jgi:phosphoglycerate dehydrogenase-like enzyme